MAPSGAMPSPNKIRSPHTHTHTRQQTANNNHNNNDNDNNGDDDNDINSNNNSENDDDKKQFDQRFGHVFCQKSLSIPSNTFSAQMFEKGRINCPVVRLSTAFFGFRSIVRSSFRPQIHMNHFSTLHIAFVSVFKGPHRPPVFYFHWFLWFSVRFPDHFSTKSIVDLCKSIHWDNL